MAANYSKEKKPVRKAVIFGICSAIIYVALFLNQGFITAYFTRGALYAILPIAGAFILSYVHGHFTGYFWSVLGIEAKKGASVKPKAEIGRPEKKEHTQPQPRMRAKV